MELAGAADSPKQHKKFYKRGNKRFLANITCPDCDFVSVFPSAMARHQMVHTGVKPFKCQHCNFASSQKCHLTRHETSHVSVEEMRAVRPSREQRASKRLCRFGDAEYCAPDVSHGGGAAAAASGGLPAEDIVAGEVAAGETLAILPENMQTPAGSMPPSDAQYQFNTHPQHADAGTTSSTPHSPSSATTSSRCACHLRETVRCGSYGSPLTSMCVVQGCPHDCASRGACVPRTHARIPVSNFKRPCGAANRAGRAT